MVMRMRVWVRVVAGKAEERPLMCKLNRRSKDRRVGHFNLTPSLLILHRDFPLCI